MAVQLTSRERMAIGRQRRKQMRRVDHGAWKPKAGRDDPLKLLAAAARGRVPELVELPWKMHLGEMSPTTSTS